MAMFSVRVSDELAARFDAAAGQEGRSVALRRLIDGATVGTTPTALQRAGPRTGARLMVRLGSAEAAGVNVEAARMSLPRATWVAALVRHRVLGRPTFSRHDELLMIGLRGELRRIGVNVNQIARALNTAVLEGRVLDTELSVLDDLRRELRAHVLALGEAFEGNLAYWTVKP